MLSSVWLDLTFPGSSRIPTSGSSVYPVTRTAVKWTEGGRKDGARRSLVPGTAGAEAKQHPQIDDIVLDVWCLCTTYK